MKRVVPVVVLVVLAAWLPDAKGSRPNEDWRASLDSLVSRQAGADSFSGVVLVARNGIPLYQRAVGVANRETGAQMTLDTKLQTASVTKLYTHIAIRQLIQAGKVSLADTLGTFLPEYPNPVARRRVTVEQLLRHRSGVGSFFNEKFMSRLSVTRTVDNYISLFRDDSLLFEPGTSETYSNGGYVLLGAIVERVSGQTYHDYVRTHIFEPAGMTNTLPYDSRVPAMNAAIGYTTQPLGMLPSGDRRLAGSGPRPGYGSPSLGPSDSTSGRMQLRLMGPDGQPLSTEQTQAAMARRAATGGVRRPNTSVQPGMSSPAGGTYSTAGDFLRLATALTSYKLLDSANTAALLGASYAEGGGYRHGGGGPGVNAELSILRNGYVIVVLSNYDPPSATTIAQKARALLASLSA